MSRRGERVVPSVLTALCLAACVNQNTWRPAVDPYNDPRAERLGVDEAQCRQIAIDASGGSLQSAGKGAVAGGLIGAAAGAALGAIAGAPGEGAALGATLGGFGGGAGQAGESQDRFKRVFSNCMRERGHRVLD